MLFIVVHLVIENGKCLWQDSVYEEIRRVSWLFLICWVIARGCVCVLLDVQENARLMLVL